MVWLAYSRISSARSSVGMVRLSALPVFDLTTSSYLAGPYWQVDRPRMQGFPGETRRSLRSPCLCGESYILTRTQVVVGAVITRHPARQLRMRIGAADGIDFLYAGRVDSELHD